jgi:tight adherence protein B
MSLFLDDPMLLFLALGLGVSLLCLFFAFGDNEESKQAKRVERLKTRGQPMARDALQLRRDQGDRGRIDLIVRHLLPRPELLRQRLQRTGKSISLGGYGVACLLTTLAGIGGLIFGGVSIMLAIPFGLLIGLWVPHYAVNFLAKRNANNFSKHFNQAVGLMIRGIKSGLPITETFQIVGNETPDPVGAEFRQISDQIRLGHPPEQALWDAAKRIDVPELKFLVVTLSIQRETGGNLAETLENLDNVLRRRRQMRMKVKAMSSEARASAMIIGALPFVMVGSLSFVNPDYIALLFTTDRGNHLLMAASGSMTFGIAVMARMVRFDI